jgi:hypothetical protein
VPYCLAFALLALCVAAALASYVARRRARARRSIVFLLDEYFSGRLTTKQLRERIAATGDRRFMSYAEFQSSSILAYQRGASSVDARDFTARGRQDALIKLLAALKIEFGLTDLYRIESYRAGRD